MSGEPRTGLVYHDRYLQHNSNPYRLPSGNTLPFVEPVDHPSNPRLVERTKKLIDLTGLSRHLAPIEAYPCPIEVLTSYHLPEYVERVRAICEAGGGETGISSPAGPDSYEIALLTVGGVLAAVDAVMAEDSVVNQCFALVRPPGHHAVANQGLGFCIFNNVAVAANYARSRYGVERILILDWDVHHGNGTQDAFYDDPNVLFFSLHQDHLLPYSNGDVDEIGEGSGAGYTINIPLPAGSGNAAYLAVFEQIVIPVAEQFQPQLVFVSAGQDASAHDPLGRMGLSTDAYRRMTAQMQKIAGAFAGGKLILAQEGGYSEIYAPYCTLAIIEQLTGVQTGIEEPMSRERIGRWPSTDVVSGDQQAVISAARESLRPYWQV